MSPSACIAIVDGDSDLMDVLREILEEGGFRVVTLALPEVRADPEAVRRLYRTEDPRVVLFDVAPPVAEDWALLQSLRSWPESRGRHFVVTTTHAVQLRAIADADATAGIEVVPKPFDIQHLLAILQRSAKTEGPAQPGA
jgi:CheY-like chemotaxis protein